MSHRVRTLIATHLLLLGLVLVPVATLAAAGHLTGNRLFPIQQDGNQGSEAETVSADVSERGADQAAPQQGTELENQQSTPVRDGASSANQEPTPLMEQVETPQAASLLGAGESTGQQEQPQDEGGAASAIEQGVGEQTDREPGTGPQDEESTDGDSPVDDEFEEETGSAKNQSPADESIDVKEGDFPEGRAAEEEPAEKSLVEDAAAEESPAQAGGESPNIEVVESEKEAPDEPAVPSIVLTFTATSTGTIELPVTTTPETTEPSTGTGTLPITVTPSVTVTPTNGGGSGTSPAAESPLATPTPTMMNSPLATPTPTTTPSSPLPTPTATIKPTAWPTAQPTLPPTVLPPALPTATRVRPTPMAQMPTATPTPPPSALQLSGYWVEKVIGDPRSDVIYAFANDWLYRSNNSGSTWRLISSMATFDEFLMSPADPDVLYSSSAPSCDATTAQSNQPMQKSFDSGSSWIELPNSANLRPLWADSASEDILFATDCDWLYLSTDGGVSWTPKPQSALNGSWTGYQILTMAEASSDANSEIAGALYVGGTTADGSGFVAVSFDFAESWQEITPKINPGPEGLTFLAVDAQQAGSVWFGDGQGVWSTADSGTSWQFVDAGLTNVLPAVGERGDSPALSSLIVHETGQLYLGTAEGLYTKSRGGGAWMQITDTDFEDSQINSILPTVIDAADGRPERTLLFLNAHEGVYLVEIAG